MFDLTSSKLIILGIVALIVVGPKDLPILLRTLGKYIGMIKRQAAEFRSQFDEAMRESELQQLKQDVENLGQEAEKAVREGGEAVQGEIASVKTDVDLAVSGASTSSSAAGDQAGAAGPALDGDGYPIFPPARSPAEVAAEAAAPKSGA